MGKCKRRSLLRARSDVFSTQLTRTDALNVVMQEMAKNPASIPAKKMIGLFGLTAEELSESGMTYEVLRSLDGILT
ncbi:MAG: hypothetical protein A2Y25_10055 [Candidatus Melainabacteria bacterium GWF2_37_15]|nr:MAG: hypothetical protein A2Y25_10055 [Candidatus Melainabacteria bacterium GWF2_37_15]